MTTEFSEVEQKALAAQMHSAIAVLDVAKVQSLLASGVPPDVWGIEDDYDLPLQAVARRKGSEALSIAKALIDAGAKINFQADYGCTALARSVEGDGSDDWSMARYLIRAGADPRRRDKDGRNPAEAASSDGRNGAVVAMLQAGMDVNVKGVIGPLIWYCAWDAADVVRELLARGANPNSVATKFPCAGQTPLQRAAESLAAGGVDEDTFCDIAIQLIQAGADPSQIEPVPDCLVSFLLARKEKAEMSSLPPGIVDRNPHGPL